MKYFLSLTLFAMLAISCNSNVSRDDAERIIKSSYRLPFVEKRQFYEARVEVTKSLNYPDLESWIMSLGHGELFLVKQGIRSVDIVSESMVDGWVPDYKKVLALKFTKGNPVGVETYLTGNTGISVFEIPVLEYEFGGINSLRKITDNEYEVVYSIKMLELKPYSEAYKKGIFIPSGEPEILKFINPENLQNIKQRILKYDKGWALEIEEKEKLFKRMTVNVEQ